LGKLIRITGQVLFFSDLVGAPLLRKKVLQSDARICPRKAHFAACAAEGIMMHPAAQTQEMARFCQSYRIKNSISLRDAFFLLFFSVLYQFAWLIMQGLANEIQRFPRREPALPDPLQL
jgi:hypothetical protein